MLTSYFKVTFTNITSYWFTLSQWFPFLTM